jgi:pilus assembly protein CpaB
MTMQTSRFLLSLCLAFVAALAAVVLAAQWNARPALDTKKIVVAAADIQPGTRLRADLLQLADWPAGSTPHGASSAFTTLEGRVTRSTLLRGEPVQEGRLAEPGATGGLSAMVAEGKRAMTVRVNDVVGVAGFALPGNFVDILVSTQEERRLAGERELSISKLVLERILVLAVAQEASQGDMRPKVVNAVTLEVTPAQAEQLDLARSVGQLSLVLRNQVDQAPTRTSGATKRSLLQTAEPAAPLPPAPRPVRVVAPPPQRECAQVLTGGGPVVQCY